MIRHIPASHNETKSTGWVDVSKGLVISLMVVGHTSIPGWLSNWIWSFHMPFFFIISALFTNWEKGSIGQFLYRKAKVLLIPFVVYSAINIAILPPVVGIGYSQYFLIILENGWGGIALWFVPVFFASITICKITSSKIAVTLGIALILVGSIFSYYTIHLPWNLSSVPFAAGMMLIVAKYQHPLRNLIQNSCVTGLIAALILGASISYGISQSFILDMCTNRILPVIPILIGICSGCIMIIALSILLGKYLTYIPRLIAHIGRNTYEIMALSQVIIMSINHYLSYSVPVKYGLMTILLIIVVHIRKFVEGRFSKVEAI